MCTDSGYAQTSNNCEWVSIVPINCYIDLYFFNPANWCLINKYICLTHFLSHRLEEFRCHNGQCIQSDLLCDGVVHCDDRSDETETECKKPEILCPDYAFRCNYGACVNRNALCNGERDCADNSDETNPQCKTSGSNNQTILCKTDEFTCNNGQCISSIALCDGTRNCADGSDEVSENCGSIMWEWFFRSPFMALWLYV